MKKIVVSLVLVALFLLSAIFVLPVGTEVTWVKEDSLSKPSSEIASIHQGDLIISGNTNYTIIDERFDINGSIIVEGNATLYLRNTVVNFIQKYVYQFNITFRNPVNGKPRLQAKNATVTSNRSFYVYFYDNSSANIISNSEIQYVFLKAFNSTLVSVSNSEIYSCSLAQDASAFVSNSTITSLTVSDSSTVSTINSAVSVNVNVGSVECSIEVKPGLFGSWNLWNNCSVVVAPSGYAPNITLVNTWVHSWHFWFKGSSNVTVNNSTIVGLGAYASSLISITNSIIVGLDVYAPCPLSITSSAITEYLFLWSKNSSTVSVTNSTIKYLYILDSSMISITNSTVDELSVSFNSVNCSIAEVKPGMFGSWNLWTNCSVALPPSGHAPNITLTNTNVQSWELWFLGSSNVTVANSTIAGLGADDSSILSLVNSTITLYTMAENHSFISVVNSKIDSSLWARDLSTVSITNSTINELDVPVSSINCSIVRIKPGTFDSWNFWSNCSIAITPDGHASNITLTNTYIQCWEFFLHGSSNATIANSIINTMHISDSCILYICNSTISNYLHISGSPIVHITNSNLPNDVYIWGSTHVSIVNSKVDWLSIRTHIHAIIEISNSTTINKLDVYYHSNVSVSDCTISEYSRVSDSSVVWFINSTYNLRYVSDSAQVYVCWYLAVHIVDKEGSDVYYANVTITHSTGTVAEKKVANVNGWASFILVEKMINATGAYPIENYTVTATYENYSGEQTVNMTGNKQITIRLPFIIPEFPTILILPLLITAALIAVIFRKNISSNGRKDKEQN